MLTHRLLAVLEYLPSTLLYTRYLHIYLPTYLPTYLLIPHTRNAQHCTSHFFIYQPWARQFGLNAQSVMVQEEDPVPRLHPQPLANKNFSLLHENRGDWEKKQKRGNCTRIYCLSVLPGSLSTARFDWLNPTSYLLT